MSTTKMGPKVIKCIYQCSILACASPVGKPEKEKRRHLIKKGPNYSCCKAPREDTSDPVSSYLPTVSLPIRSLKFVYRC